MKAETYTKEFGALTVRFLVFVPTTKEASNLNRRMLKNS
jgi:hypothetical protein